MPFSLSAWVYEPRHAPSSLRQTYLVPVTGLHTLLLRKFRQIVLPSFINVQFPRLSLFVAFFLCIASTIGTTPSMIPHKRYRRPSNLNRVDAHYPFQKNTQALSFSLKPVVSAFKRNEWYLLRAVGQGRIILRQFVWKHHFSPIDTSNVVAWLTTPANLIPPSRPIISCVPNEILTKIFLFVTHSDCTIPKDHYSKEILYSSVSSGSSPTTPLILGQVCSFWRNLVHSTPNLWSTIVVHSPLPKHVEVVSFWLDRSANYPLDLRLEQFFSPDPASYTITELFVSQAYRWKRISFTLGIETPFAKLRVDDTPMLEEYRIRLEKWNPAKAHSFIEVLHSSPVLHTINWGKSIHARLPTGTPWHQLSNIAFQNLEMSEVIIAGLSQCVALKVLHLRYMGRSNTHNLSIVLPQLERLVCEIRNESYPIFDFFTLPSLNYLHWIVSHCLSKKDALMVSLINMVDRSGCTLKTLAVNITTLDLVSTRLGADITTLYVHDGVVNSDLLKLIRRPGQCAVPRLQHLFLETCLADDGVLSTVVLSRSSELKTVRVCLDRQRSSNDIITLRWLQRDGIAVDIQEPFFQSHIVSYTCRHTVDPDPDSDTITALRLPDMETLWT